MNITVSKHNSLLALAIFFAFSISQSTVGAVDLYACIVISIFLVMFSMGQVSGFAQIADTVLKGILEYTLLLFVSKQSYLLTMHNGTLPILALFLSNSRSTGRDSLGLGVFLGAHSSLVISPCWLGFYIFANRYYLSFWLSARSVYKLS